MHPIYHTRGIILGSFESGEADRRLAIYAEDFGLIYAHAQGIRKLESKLRFALQDFSLAEIDLVRGRALWRVTSATSIETFPLIRGDSHSLALFAHMAGLIRTLCHGEEDNTLIFADLSGALAALEREDLSRERREAVEHLFVLRMLGHLGYIGNHEALGGYLSGAFNVDIYDPKDREAILVEINRGLKESQL